jgi:hypothetical protein
MLVDAKWPCHFQKVVIIEIMINIVGVRAYFKISASNPTLKSKLFSEDFRALSWVNKLLNI